MKHIGNLQYADGARHKKKRIARGPGSGHGGTSTRGHKGQKSRKSYHHPSGFEGGQMPLNRRLPKFGFNNRSRIEYQVVNVGDLQKLFDQGKFGGTKVDMQMLFEAGAITKSRVPVKILGNGSVETALQVEAHGFSETAKQKIESAGGTVTIHG